MKYQTNSLKNANLHKKSFSTSYLESNCWLITLRGGGVKVASPLFYRQKMKVSRRSTMTLARSCVRWLIYASWQNDCCKNKLHWMKSLCCFTVLKDKRLFSGSYPLGNLCVYGLEVMSEYVIQNWMTNIDFYGTHVCLATLRGWTQLRILVLLMTLAPYHN